MDPVGGEELAERQLHSGADVDQVRIGARVELTFRKLFTADGIHNYFWKARIADG